MRTVLLLRALGLGDFLAGVPAYRAVRRALPDHEVTLAAPAVLAPLVPLTAAVDRLLPAAELQPVPWSGPAPDLAIDLHGNGPASRTLLEQLGPRRVLGFASETLPVPGAPVWNAEEPERERWCRLLTDGLGAIGDPDDVVLARPPGPRSEPVIVVHPGAAYGARRWPVERFAAVAEALRGHGRVAVTGGRSEVELARRCAALAGLGREAVLAGRTDLADLARVVADARLVVSGDTGVAHLAWAYGRPSVTLYGPTPPRLWGPPARPQHRAIWRGRDRGDPWADQPGTELLAVTVDDVLADVTGLTERAA